jgi:hypothetical protein
MSKHCLGLQAAGPESESEQVGGQLLAGQMQPDVQHEVRCCQPHEPLSGR